ncbi:MAG: tetratricopeptide repeat protein [Desulfoarculaceae bacterium]|nr:tetratricopeptide repeat protein [Desulfoarculaceae bacterium]
MTNTTLQPIQNIAPVAQKKRSSDPAQAEYEDGKEFLEKKELAQAAMAFHNALVTFEEKDDQNGIANASNQLGLLCLQRQEYEMALKHYQRAWDICEKKNDPMSLLALSHQLVTVRQGLKQYPEAVKVCLDLLAAYHRNNNPEGVVTTLERMAGIYLETGDKAKAADGYRTIASIHAKYKHKNIAERFMAKAQALEEVV